MLSAILLCVFFSRISEQKIIKALSRMEPKNCESVCRDLPPTDTQPVCMMASRYKKGYLYFANHCQARLAMCIENFDPEDPANVDVPNHEEEVYSTPPEDPQPSLVFRRSTRSRRMPQRLNDFILGEEIIEGKNDI